MLKILKKEPPYYCEKFLLDSSKNPETGDPIEIYGSEHKKFMKKCKNFDIKKIKFKKFQEICENWQDNAILNPSKYLQVKHDKIYQKVFKNCNVNICGSNYFSISFGGETIDVPNKIKDWTLVRVLGQGGFGLVIECYHATNRETLYAMKLEHVSSEGLPLEMEFYHDNHKNKYIPKYFDSGIVNEKIRYLVIEKLFPVKFTDKTIQEIISGLESFAKVNKTHGDIKLPNIMQRKNKEVVFVDFGLSLYIEPKKIVIDKYNIAGTPYFMSVTSHKGIVTYRNDLESLVYILLDSIHTLPWYRIHKNNSILQNKIKFIELFLSQDDVVMDKFKMYDNPGLFFFAKNVFTLAVHEFPDYTLLKSFFR